MPKLPGLWEQGEYIVQKKIIFLSLKGTLQKHNQLNNSNVLRLILVELKIQMCSD